ncbi:SYNTAXIN-43-LIKE [Salix purpurea]|uniref:SYNTAXIN-43-LIKE n=1 Tax=Salix purpurea TaxID=77065 RepID=A0A9Q0WZP3_SALPP|nr:SYNTAXIN-43-LIKE [Salix purpurea]
MATRNRTLIFRKYRDALKSVRVPSSSSPSTSSNGGGGGPVIELASTSFLNHNRKYTPLSTEDPGNSSKGALTVGLPPAWVDVSEEISRRNCKDLLRLGLLRIQTSGKNVQRSLATDLQNLSMELRRKQSTYLKRLRQQKEGQDGVDLEMNLNGGRSILDDDNLDDMVFNEHQMAKLKKSEAFTVEREREIEQVVESVNELAQIMKDLSVLVIDQGTIVDRIDYNIQNVETTIEEGLKQLQKAERTQKRGGMVMCATALVIMCFIMLVLLVLKTILF